MAKKKLIILGMDGLDPKLVKRFISEGDLSNFKSIAERGTFQNLETSNPPQSPVAWSCFISGENPGQHDVFDFVNRNPSTYLPEVGMTEEKKEGDSFFRKMMAGLTGPSLKTRRKGKSFWDRLSENGIKSVILRCPVTFPAEPLHGCLLSGMGTPDIRGTQGISSFYTTQSVTDKDLHGKNITVSWKEGTIQTEIYGPRVAGPAGTKEITIPLSLEFIDEKSVQIILPQEKRTLKIGEWSPWIRLEFKTGLFQSLYGIVKFHLSAVRPDLALFMTPVNLDPQRPAFPISYPNTYAKEIFQKIGNYYTQGIPYDTWALNEERLTETEFLEQAYSVLDENLKTLDMELNRFDSGLLFCYFGITDLIQHMFWRYEDPGHPSQGRSTDPVVREAIRRVYQRMDEIVGDVVNKMGADTTLIVLSDHGFGSFRRAVHINSWLRDHGYLVLMEGAKEGADFLANVDWEQTRAYSVGFGGIYINQFGREKMGTIYEGTEKEALKKELISKLEAWRDKDGSAVIKKVYTNEDLYQGPYSVNGPDLYIGFNLSYRASWQTGLGGAPEPKIEDNQRIWSGDHLSDPSLVPGVFISNQKTESPNLSLLDMAAIILRHFNIN